MAARRRWVGNRVALAVLALVALAGVSACSGSSTPHARGATPTPTPTTWAPASTIALSRGDAPQNIIGAFGSLWVPAHHAGVLVRVDPSAGKVVARIKVGPKPGSVVESADALWVVDYEAPLLIEVNPKTNAVVRRITLPAPGCCQAAITDGLVWVSSGEGDSANLEAYDTTTGKRVRRLHFLAQPAFALGKLWATKSTGDLVQVNPANGAVTGTAAPAAAGLDAHAASHELAWAATAGGGVVGLDATGAVKVEAKASDGNPIFQGGGQVVAGADSVWVADELGNVSRIDPMTGMATRLTTLDPSYTTLAELDGRLWVAEFEADKLLGFDLPR